MKQILLMCLLSLAFTIHYILIIFTSPFVNNNIYFLLSFLHLVGHATIEL